MSLGDGEQLGLLEAVFRQPPDPRPARTGYPVDLPPVPPGALPVRHSSAAPAEAPPQHKLRAASQLSMLGSYADPRIATLVPDPPEYEGWREELGRPMPEMWRGNCGEQRRPCPRTSCRLHLLLNVDAEGALTLNDGDQHRLGRPPSLTVNDGAEDAVDFERDALARLAVMTDTCADDVAKRTRKSGVSLTEAETGAYLGVSHETVRLDMVSIGTKLRDLAAEGGFDLMDEHADPADAIAAIGAVLVAKERARAPAAPPVQIRRKPKP